MSDKLSAIWGKIYGCADNYICANALYLMSMLLQYFSVIIYRGISAPGNGREVVDSLNAFDKMILFQ